MTKAKLKTIEKRSDCPLSCTLDLVGDKWSLLIIRDMMLFEKTTYNEFLASNEKIATNILKDRLISLTEKGLITYTGTAKRKKYKLTSLGMELKPIIEAIANFGLKNFPKSKIYTQKQMKAKGKALANS
jgi:DNA-binding HxlR family transcriptional regulator